jgi:hypothetical protein
MWGTMSVMVHNPHNNPYPDAVDPNRVGNYPARVYSGGGYFYDAVLEYRVWVHPTNDEVYYRPFTSYNAALKFSNTTPDAEKPLALVSQEEYIDEPTPGVLMHVKKPRLAEWLPEWLESSKGTKENIPRFLQDFVRGGGRRTGLDRI